jgi:hypothetical protein
MRAVHSGLITIPVRLVLPAPNPDTFLADGKTFRHTSSSGVSHNDVILNYIGWDNTRWTMRIE